MSTAKMTFSVFRFSRLLEPLIYAGLATVMIGQVFFIDGLFTVRHAWLVLSGEAFGLLAACVAAPLTLLVQRLFSGRTELDADLADVLPFVRPKPADDQTQPQDDSPRAA